MYEIIFHIKNGTFTLVYFYVIHMLVFPWKCVSVLLFLIKARQKM